MHSCIRQPETARNQAEVALTRGWESLTRLMQQGGAINLQGDILVMGTNGLNFPRDVQSRLQQELTLGVSPWQFSQLSGLPSKMPLEWGDMNWGVQLVLDEFAKHLGYRRGNNRAVFSLVLASGEVRSERDFRSLRHALGEHIVQSYARERVARIIAPGIAVTQLLVDIADTMGRGKVRERMRQVEQTRVEFGCGFDY